MPSREQKHDLHLLLRKRKPCHKSGKFFVLRPRRAKRTAQIGELTAKCIRLQMKFEHGFFTQFALFRRERFNTAAPACVEQCFAKKLSVSRVNQRMRRQNLRESR